MTDRQRLRSYLRFFTTDDLRIIWRSMPGGGSAARTSLRDEVTISRVELEAEIQRRTRWERFGNSVLLVASIIAAVAAVVGAVAAVIAAGAPALSIAAQSGGKITLQGIWLPYVVGGGIILAALLFWCRTQWLLLYAVIEVIVGLTLMVLASQVQGPFSAAFSDSFDVVRTTLTVTTYLGGVFATVRGFDNIKTAVVLTQR